jgi:PTH1 family peptidyl-tRNA hydrolase
MNKYLIIGLGNTGEAYEHTRHNIGFDVLGFLAEKYQCIWEAGRFATVAKFKLKGNLVVLMKPTTFMNLSGKAVQYWMQKEKIRLEHIFVVVDDLALPLEKFRVRGSGSDAGHNGLKDIGFQLQTTAYARLRFGIGNQFQKGKQVGYVLGKWEFTEMPLVTKKISVAALIIEKFILEGIDATMNFSNPLTVEV